MELPKRCKSCRGNKRIGNTYNPEYNDYSYSTSKNNSNSPGGGSFCFLTTVVCDYYGKPDNCFELETMRRYRDTWLRNQPGGRKLIAEYYNTALLLVSLLEKSEYYSEYCETMHDKYIMPCLELIFQKKYKECRRLYEQMFYYLKSELC